MSKTVRTIRPTNRQIVEATRRYTIVSNIDAAAVAELGLNCTVKEARAALGAEMAMVRPLLERANSPYASKDEVLEMKRLGIKRTVRAVDHYQFQLTDGRRAQIVLKNSGEFVNKLSRSWFAPNPKLIIRISRGKSGWGFFRDSSRVYETRTKRGSRLINHLLAAIPDAELSERVSNLGKGVELIETIWHYEGAEVLVDAIARKGSIEYHEDLALIDANTKPGVEVHLRADLTKREKAKLRDDLLEKIEATRRLKDEKKAERKKRLEAVITMPLLARELGFCSAGMREFAELIGIDPTGRATVAEILKAHRDAVKRGVCGLSEYDEDFANFRRAFA